MKNIDFWVGEGKKKCLEYRGNFFLLLGIYLLAFSALIRANFGYVDDLGRTFAGYHGWLDWSRWSTQILATFVHADWYLTDISPLPQLMACVFMAVGGIILLTLFRGGEKLNTGDVLAVSLTGLGPYFLGIISYKFDSPYMALSFLASLIPFWFRKGSQKVYLLVSVICLLIMCTTYQASSGIYPMLAFFLCMKEINEGKEGKESVKRLLLSALAYLFSLGIFWLFLMRENGVSVFSFSRLIPDTLGRYIRYYKMVYEDFTLSWLLLIGLILLVFIGVFCHTTKQKKTVALFLAGFTLLVSSFLCFGAYLFISEEAYDARSMFGFNVFVALLAVYISCACRNWLPKLINAALAWCFLVFALTHGNALSQQQNYIDYRVGLVAADLNELEVMKGKERKRLKVEGDIGLAPVVVNMTETYPLLKRTVFTGFSEGYWGEYYLLNYFALPNIEGGVEEGVEGNLPLLKETAYHTIKGDGDTIVIELK